jgi:hypothetical protein
VYELRGHFLTIPGKGKAFFALIIAYRLPNAYLCFICLMSLKYNTGPGKLFVHERGIDHERVWTTSESGLSDSSPAGLADPEAE